MTALDAPRTETVLYGSGRCLPDPDATPRQRLDDARELASRYLRDDVGVTEESVLDLCEAIETLDLQRLALVEQLAMTHRRLAESQRLVDEHRRATLAARDALRALTLDLETAREDVARAEELRAAALADAEQMRAVAIRLSRENRELRLSPLRCTAVVSDIADLVAAAPTFAIRREIVRVDPPEQMRTAYAAPTDFDTTDLDTVVCEMPIGCAS